MGIKKIFKSAKKQVKAVKKDSPVKADVVLPDEFEAKLKRNQKDPNDMSGYDFGVVYE